MNLRSILALIVVVIIISGLYILAIVYDNKRLTKTEIVKILNSYKTNNLLVEGEFWIDTKDENISEAAVKYIKAIVINYLITSMQLARDKYGVDINYIGMNELVKSERINVFFINDDPENILKKLRVSGNAAYIGFDNIIVFDKKFVDSFLYAADFGSMNHAGLSDEELKSLRSEFWMHRRMMFFWLVAHEVGHITKHRSIKAKNEHPSYVTQVFSKDREIEADRFVVEVLQSDPGKSYEFAQANRLWFGLHSYSSRISKELFNKSITDLILGDEAITVPVESLTHPPKFFRAVSMNSVLAEIYGFESPNRYKDLVKRIIFKEVDK